MVAPRIDKLVRLLVAAVDDVLAVAPEELAALVLEGDPGIGKTTVWRKAMARARNPSYRVPS